MQPAPTPPNESDRLAALRRYEILDTPPEADFDDFARLASLICGTPSATITLIDEARQWFKSSIGMGMSESARDISFCGNTILGSQVLEVTNALEDERFHDSPLVTGAPKVRFYAGAPLVTPDGLNIGALCVLDATPRRLTQDQREMLMILSRQVVHLLELRLAGRRISWLNDNLEQLVAKRTEEIAEKAAFLDKARDAILNLDLDGKILFWNKGAERMYGWAGEEAVGRNVTDIVYAGPDAFEKIACTVLEKGELSDETEHVTKDGRRLTVEVRRTLIRDNEGRARSTLAIITDITERKRIETQFMRTQRMESLGTLAGGIAHDLNNSLAPILMVAGLLRTQYPKDTKLIDTVESSAKRGADMVRQLLTFAKGVEGERLLLNPQRLLKEMAKIIEGTFPRNIQLRIACANDLHGILGDATQLHQVLLNLCVNARDAMPNGGTLTLEADNREIDATFARSNPDAKPGHHIVWRVADTGTGIPPEVMEHIFEPFFSTKGPDKGTGLGLSSVVGIVRSHGGFVQVYSVPGHGTTFAVYLPAERACCTDASTPPFPVSAFRGHGETILVVDDEADVRQAVQAVLTSLDFKVLVAANGSEALVQAAEKREELRAVITDLHMPGIDGFTLARVLRGMLPEVGIIVASGRIEEREKKLLRTFGVSTLLDKPFTQKKLEEALKAGSRVLHSSDEEEEAGKQRHTGDSAGIPALAGMS